VLMAKEHGEGNRKEKDFVVGISCN